MEHTTQTAPVRELGETEGAFTVGAKVGKDLFVIVGVSEKYCFVMKTGRSEGKADEGDTLGSRLGCDGLDVG